MKILEVGALLFLLWNSMHDIRKKEIVPLSILLFVVARLLFFAIQIPDIKDTLIYQSLTLLAGIFPGAVIYLIGRISKGTIGQGDGIVLAVTGLYIGVESIMEVIMWGFFLASIWCMTFLWFKKYRWKSRIAFIPFLLAGYVLSLMI